MTWQAVLQLRAAVPRRLYGFGCCLFGCHGGACNLRQKENALVENEMQELIEKSEKAREALKLDVDKDSNSFIGYIEATRLPGYA